METQGKLEDREVGTKEGSEEGKESKDKAGKPETEKAQYEALRERDLLGAKLNALQEFRKWKSEILQILDQVEKDINTLHQKFTLQVHDHPFPDLAYQGFKFDFPPIPADPKFRAMELTIDPRRCVAEVTTHGPNRQFVTVSVVLRNCFGEPVRNIWSKLYLEAYNDGIQLRGKILDQEEQTSPFLWIPEREEWVSLQHHTIQKQMAAISPQIELALVVGEKGGKSSQGSKAENLPSARVPDRRMINSYLLSAPAPQIEILGFRSGALPGADKPSWLIEISGEEYLCLRNKDTDKDTKEKEKDKDKDKDKHKDKKSDERLEKMEKLDDKHANWIPTFQNSRLKISPVIPPIVAPFKVDVASVLRLNNRELTRLRAVAIGHKIREKTDGMHCFCVAEVWSWPGSKSETKTKFRTFEVQEIPISAMVTDLSLFSSWGLEKPKERGDFPIGAVHTTSSEFLLFWTSKFTSASLTATPLVLHPELPLPLPSPLSFSLSPSLARPFQRKLSREVRRVQCLLGLYLVLRAHLMLYSALGEELSTLLRPLHDDGEFLDFALDHDNSLIGVLYQHRGQRSVQTYSLAELWGKGSVRG